MHSPTPKILILIVTAMLLSIGSIHAEKTLRGKLRANRSLVTPQPGNDLSVKYDTIKIESQDVIRLSGYDKPLNSRKESLFVTNKLPRDIIALEVHLTYTDMNGRMLHETTRLLQVDVPTGTTRRVDFPTWDVQNSFYYYKGRKPKTSNVTPFKVACEVTHYIALSTPLMDNNPIP